MPSCPRCFALTQDDFAYCPVCARPRIVENLRAPAPPSWWLPPLQRAALVLGSLWLLVTLGVACLREAKAVRDARQLLAEDHPQDAWARLEPFLKDNPEHVQGLLLCGEATIRLGRMPDATQCLAALTRLDPQLGRQLAEEVRQTLTQRARTLGCNSDGFSYLLESAQGMGAPFTASVLDGLDAIADACRKQRNEWVPLQVAALLAKQGLPHELLEKGYVPALTRALAGAHYGDARALALLAFRLDPDGAGEINKVLGTERARVAATTSTLGALCEKLQGAPQYHTGSGWCFPGAAPAEVQAAKDAWGKGIRYIAFNPAPGQACFTGIALISYGGAAGPVRSERQSPAAGIACRVLSGVESWQHPDRFWQVSPEAGEGEAAR